MLDFGINRCLNNCYFKSFSDQLRIVRWCSFRNILQNLNQAGSFRALLEFVEFVLFLFRRLARKAVSPKVSISCTKMSITITLLQINFKVGSYEHINRINVLIAVNN